MPGRLGEAGHVRFVWLMMYKCKARRVWKALYVYSGGLLDSDVDM